MTEPQWKYNAKMAWHDHVATTEKQEAEHKANRILRAKEELEAALKMFSIPVNRDDIRVEETEDFGEIPYVTVDGVGFTLGPNRQPNHGGGLGIVTTCPRCSTRLRGPYVYDEKILGQQLIEPERVKHVCQTIDEVAQEIEERKDGEPETAEERLLSALREMIDEGARLRMEEGL